jgi:hypothetical protein
MLLSRRLLTLPHLGLIFSIRRYTIGISAEVGKPGICLVIFPYMVLYMGAAST